MVTTRHYAVADFGKKIVGPDLKIYVIERVSDVVLVELGSQPVPSCFEPCYCENMSLPALME